MSKRDLLAESDDDRVGSSPAAAETGQAPASAGDGATPMVEASWHRSRRHGLEHEVDDAAGDAYPPEVLTQLLERNAYLLTHARGIVHNMYEQIRGSGSVVGLADASGVLLECFGDSEFSMRARRIGLRAGADWSEGVRGTNAIGTAAATQLAVEITGREHFLDSCTFLTCAAAPIRDAESRVVGLLAIASDVDNRQQHTPTLVAMATQLIEKRLFEADHVDSYLLAFHPTMACIGTLQEGLLALTDDGHVLAANRKALELLAIDAHLVSRLDFDLLFDEPFDRCLERALRDPVAVRALAGRHGQRHFARMALPRGAVEAVASALPAAPPRPAGRPGGRRKSTDLPPTLAAYADADPALQALAERAQRIVGKDIPLLILGESGVGKEHFAKAFHASSPRRDNAFVALNCAAMPEGLIESELFGYVGGAFTGARKEGSRGRIQQACGGTLFLDEIGDMPLGLQARLLRVLQERMVTPLGAAEPVEVDISLVCATHRDLLDGVRHGRFRQDLYFRINGLTVTLPPLRERADLRDLVLAIVEAEREPDGDVLVSEAVFDLFAWHAWPGNIRELQNVVRVALALQGDDEPSVAAHHLPEDFLETVREATVEATREAVRSRSAAPALAPAIENADANDGDDSLAAIERRAIERLLAECGGNLSAAARHLGVSRNTLYRKLGRARRRP
ncbi:MAG: sigma-54-dependent Fis family transcriptional regulator [Zoogloeaceae bacterium]|nr:sigma-54-dependent Fis family transcriptional regulator [Rhodocyclaceae bacterium]MCP5235753.1 sigma-54-dependent Fis family transcriptional regulator [Zoogloeaceae bacterium]